MSGQGQISNVKNFKAHNGSCPKRRRDFLGISEFKGGLLNPKTFVNLPQYQEQDGQVSCLAGTTQSLHCVPRGTQCNDSAPAYLGFDFFCNNPGEEILFLV